MQVTVYTLYIRESNDDVTVWSFGSKQERQKHLQKYVNDNWDSCWDSHCYEDEEPEDWDSDEDGEWEAPDHSDEDRPIDWYFEHTDETYGYDYDTIEIQVPDTPDIAKTTKQQPVESLANQLRERLAKIK